jgi:hypothetical protein
MDEPGRNAAILLEGLQDAMGQLRRIWNHYLRLGTQPGRPFLVLSVRPFTIHEGQSDRHFSGSVSIGLPVKGASGDEYELSVDLLWDDTNWTITTEAWVEADGGQSLLRELRERSAASLSSCLEHLRQAVDSLVDFQDLVLANGPD